MNYLFGIITALLIVLGVPFLFKAQLRFLDSRLSIDVKFYLWVIYSWSKEFNSKPDVLSNNLPDHHSGCSTTPLDKTVKYISSDSENKLVDSDTKYHLNDEFMRVDSIEKSIEKSVENNHEDKSDKSKKLDDTGSLSQPRSRNPNKNSSIISKKNKKDKLNEAKVPLELRYLRTILDTKVLLKLTAWAYGRSVDLVKLFNFNLKIWHFEMRTIDPMLLAKISSLLGGLSGVHPLIAKGRWAVVYGPDAYLLKLNLTSSWNLGLLILYACKCIWTLPLRHLYGNWKLSKNELNGLWEEKLVQFIWKQIK